MEGCSPEPQFKPVRSVLLSFPGWLFKLSTLPPVAVTAFPAPRLRWEGGGVLAMISHVRAEGEGEAAVPLPPPPLADPLHGVSPFFVCRVSVSPSPGRWTLCSPHVWGASDSTDPPQPVPGCYVTTSAWRLRRLLFMGFNVYLSVGQNRH